MHIYFILVHWRLWKLNITVGTTKVLAKQSLCKFYDDTVPSAGSATIVCNRIVRGTYLAIQRTTRYGIGPNDNHDIRKPEGYLTLCEVQVIGYQGKLYSLNYVHEKCQSLNTAGNL